MITPDELIERGREVFDIEIEGMHHVRNHLDVTFANACHLCAKIMDEGGKIVVSGVGKSGHIGRKIAATLASTGSPSIYMHPVEAMHGDIGVLQAQDILIAISYSGETDELLWILPAAKRLGVPIIALTANAESRLGKFADCLISCAVEREACPFNLAPTTTTTVTLAVGDALAMVLLKLRGFTREDFGRLHPGGAIGRAITLTIREIMRTEGRLATVTPEQTVKETLMAMTRARSGAAAVIDENRKVIGIFTDGDFRRHIETESDILSRPIQSVMTHSPIVVKADLLVVEALKIYESRKIDDIIAINDDGTLAGIVDLQDLPGLKLF